MNSATFAFDADREMIVARANDDTATPQLLESLAVVEEAHANNLAGLLDVGS